MHGLSSLHVGAGRGVGYIDLPVMRERVTGWPFIPGSAVKGVVADYFGACDEGRRKDPELRTAFGAAQSNDASVDASSGSLVFTDARLLCIPVRSFAGVFAWTTSPLVLGRLARDLEACGQIVPDIPSLAPGSMLTTSKTALSSPVGAGEQKAFLEDLDFALSTDAAADAWAALLGKSFFEDEQWRTLFTQRFAVVHDDVFSFFCETGTQVDARIRISQETKVVMDGALWYEESLPAETMLSGMVWCDRIFGGNATPSDVLNRFCGKSLHLQIGGKATTGRGRAVLSFS